MKMLPTTNCSVIRPDGKRCGRVVLVSKGYCERCLREGHNPIADAREAKKAERKAQAEARAEARRIAERRREARRPGGGLQKRTVKMGDRELAEKRARQLEISKAGPKKGSTHEVKGGRGTSRKARRKARS